MFRGVQVRVGCTALLVLLVLTEGSAPDAGAAPPRARAHPPEPDTFGAALKDIQLSSTQESLQYLATELQHLLIRAAQVGDLSVVKSAVEAGASVDYLTEDGNSALKEATKAGQAAVVEALLATYGADPDAECKLGVTALMVAANVGDAPSARALLQGGASVDHQMTTGATALIVAAESGHVEVVSLLLGFGADVEKSLPDRWNALMSAAQNGHLEVVRLLLQGGAHVELSKIDKVTPLQVAAYRGYTDIVQLMLDYGASVETPALNSYTALMWACQNGHRDVAERLLQHGAAADWTDGRGRPLLCPTCTFGEGSALLVATSHCHADLVELLLKYGALVDRALQERGPTPLAVAAATNCSAGGDEARVVRALLRGGADPSLAAADHLTPLHSASQLGKLHVVQELVAWGVDTEAAGPRGLTALMLASYYGHSEVVRLLLQHGAQINAATHGTLSGLSSYRFITQDGLTALMLAAQGQHEAVCEVLLRHGAFTELRSAGKLFGLYGTLSALDIALGAGHHTLAALLKYPPPPTDVVLMPSECSECRTSMREECMHCMEWDVPRGDSVAAFEL